MNDMQKICLVIPCYNEQGRLPISEFVNNYNHSEWYYLFVNDGSKDSTIDILNQFKKGREDRVMVVDYKVNKGKSEAVRIGCLNAVKWQDFSIIGYIDADLEIPLSEVPKITGYINKDVHFAFGSRVRRIGATIERKGYRALLGRTFAIIAAKLLKIKVYDTQCGAKFFHSRLITNLFAEKFVTNWIFDVEIFFRLIKLNKNSDINEYAREVPLDICYDHGGSRIKLVHFIKIPYELLN